MQLSIVTVCYNEKDIGRTCESIVSQSCQDFEWIVVDGGSTDGSLEVIKHYKERIDILISEPDNGIYDAMNKGIRPAADVIYGDFNRMLPDGGVRKSEFPDVVDKVFFYNKSVNHQASFIRSRLFRRFGMYDETFRIAADMDKWLMFVNNGCLFRHWERYVANFYLDGISSTHKQLLAEELGCIHEKRYGRREEKTVLQKISSRRDFLLFDIFPLLEIDDKNAGQTTVCKLFGVLPVYRKVSKHGKVRHYLFGFIPFLKIRQK